MEEVGGVGTVWKVAVELVGADGCWSVVPGGGQLRWRVVLVLEGGASQSKILHRILQYILPSSGGSSTIYTYRTSIHKHI